MFRGYFLFFSDSIGNCHSFHYFGMEHSTSPLIKVFVLAVTTVSDKYQPLAISLFKYGTVCQAFKVCLAVIMCSVRWHC